MKQEVRKLLNDFKKEKLLLIHNKNIEYKNPLKKKNIQIKFKQ